MKKNKTIKLTELELKTICWELENIDYDDVSPKQYNAIQRVLKKLRP
jgi:(p)ppGpp synthase/HD superfamily hydrolase